MADPRIANAAVVGTTLWSDLRDVWDKAGKTATLITLPTLSVATLVNKLLEPVLTLWEVVALTWPLVISATLLALLAWPGRRERRQAAGFGGILVLSSIILIPYLIAALLGLAPDVSTRFDDKHQAWNPITWFMVPAANILAAYFSSWGLARTLSAMACGIFLAWVFETKLLPRLPTSDPPVPG